MKRLYISISLLILLAGCYQQPTSPERHLPETVQSVSDFLSLSMMPDVISNVQPEMVELEFTMKVQGQTRRIKWSSEVIEEAPIPTVTKLPDSVPEIESPMSSSRGFDAAEDDQWFACMGDHYINRMAAWLRGNGFFITPCQRVYGSGGEIRYADLVFDGRKIALQIEGDKYVDELSEKRTFLRQQGYEVHVVSKDMMPDASGQTDVAFKTWIQRIVDESPL